MTAPQISSLKPSGQAEDSKVIGRPYRLDNIDFLRGLVIIIMALDHVRDYLGAGLVAQNPTSDDASLATFFTRIITHLCAPIFVFLAGTSAGLLAIRRSPQEVGRFLLTRGLWLVLIELVVVSQLWTFNFSGLPFLGGLVGLSFQVIGAIGVSMIVLGGLQLLGAKVCLILGLIIVVGHNSLDSFWPTPNFGETGVPLWVSLHAQMASSFGPFSLFIAYPPLPWIGIILLGYSAASLFNNSNEKQSLQWLVVGISMLLLFFLLRLTQAYGDPNEWKVYDDIELTLRSIFNVTKYPPSLLFTLLTLGVGSLILAAYHKIPRPIQSACITFGRAPFAVYIAHLLLIHSAACVLGVLQGFEIQQFFTLYFMFPNGYGLSLFGVYIAWVVLMIALYPFAAWMNRVKSQNKHWWLSYL
ncbi:MAG: DUF1624 domain-containing protein [Gammaproteobacteria bacterium]|nr:DUF1624 domain-containing protein [Gammaproteobacteria bacterium]